MSIPNQVPESSMEEILASIRKIISEDESKDSEAAEASAPPPPRPSLHAGNVSPLFADRPDPVLSGGDRATTRPAPDKFETRREPSVTGRSVDIAAVSEKADVSPPRPRPPEPAYRQQIDRRLLSSDAEAAVTGSLSELKSAAARSVPQAVEQLAAELMRPMVKAWLDENLPALVERIVRDEIERLSRRR